MAEKPRYWDLHRCAWVDVEPASDIPLVPPAASDGESSPTADAAVPEQRPDRDAPLVAGTPD